MLISEHICFNTKNEGAGIFNSKKFIFRSYGFHVQKPYLKTEGKLYHKVQTSVYLGAFLGFKNEKTYFIVYEPFCICSSAKSGETSPSIGRRDNISTG